jgi:TP901 family phage tail tape measure protein
LPDFELRFVAVPEIKQDADKDLRKQWERRFQNQVVGKLAVDAEIPKQTLTKLRNQYAQIMNDLGKTTLDVGRDIAGLRQQYGKAFDMTGITDQFKSDLAKTGNTIESLTQAAEKHAEQVRQLESEYVNLKAKMREAAQTLEGEAKTSAIDELEAKVRDLGEQIKRTFGADELEHFNRTMGELGGKGSAQVVGVQEYADSISGLRTRIVELAGEGERLVRVTQEWDGKQWIDTSTQIQDRTQKLRDEFKKFEKQVRDLENRYQLSKAGSSYAQEWKNMTHEMESFNAEMPDARQNLERWQEVLSKTKGELGNAGNNLSKYKEQLKDVRDAEVALKLAQLESHGLRTTAVIQAEAVVEEKRREAEETKRLLVNTDKLNDANVAYTKSEEALKQSLDKTEKAWKKKNSLLSNISAGFADATARIINYTSVYRAMWFAISKFKQSIQTAEELNKAFTSIQLVTLGTAEATEKLRKEYADLAHEMSATVTDVAEGADAWLRQGKSAEEATQLIRASMVMSRIGVIKSAEATEYLTSVLNGYNMEAQDVMHVVDAMSQVDIESASSIDDLAIALQRSTATAQQAGVSFERLLGYVAAVRETTQRSASVIGEAMKSIFSRMGSVKAGTFLSEDLESEYSDITTYVNDVEKVLSKVGIRLRDTNKDFRDAQDILDEVAKGWETYDDLTKQALATAIAGTRQRENFLALMQSYDKALALENSALNSNGKAMQKYAVYQDSIAAKQDRINALAQTWVQNMNFEWVIGELLSLGEAFMKVFSNKLVVQAGMATAAILAFVKAARSLILMGKLFMEMRGVVSTGTLLTQILGAAGLGTVLPVVVALTIAITGLVYIIDKLHHSSAELAQELQGLDNEIDSSQSEIDEYKSKIAENDKKIQELQDTINKGIGGLVEQDELDRLKEENKQLERQISLEQKRLDLVKEQRKQTAEELYGKKFRVGRYSVGYGRNTATKDVHQYGSVEVAPEDVIATYQKQIDDLRKEYEKAADNNNEKLAKTIEAKINELESELTNTVVPQLELLREYYPEIAEVLDAYYDSLMSYADRVENIKVEYPDEYAEFGEIVAENSEAFQAYLDGDDEALNEFADILSGKASPAIYAMIVAMQQAGIPLAELIRLLLNAANAGEDLSNSIKLETPVAQIERFKDKVKSVVSAEEELAETGYVSADAAAELAEAYGEEVYDAMVWTSKGYKISRSELEALIEKQKESYVLALNDAKRAAVAVIEANGGKTLSWNTETSAILANIKATKQAMAAKFVYMRGVAGVSEQWQEIVDAEDSLANAQENYDNLLKTLAYLRTSTTKTSGKSDAETAYEREIRLLEHEVYLSQQMADFYDGENDEANYRAEVNKQMAIYIKLMDAAHAEAERLRALGYAETSEEIQNLQQAWWGYYNKRRDLATGLADWEKQTTEDALNDVKDAINDLLDEAEDKLKDKLDALQAKIDKNEAIKKLHEVFFGILNDVADGIHEIDKELEASLSSADYLDEQLRQAMFNEDDYNKMSAKLNQIADESRVLFKDYLNQLEMLTEDEIYKADYITDEFERQYQYKELEYAIAEKELALAKAQTKLQNTLMNRNVRMYKNGQWIWTADYSAVQEAKKEVRDAEYEYRDAEIKLKQQEVLDKYAGIISALNLQKDAAQNEFDRLKDYWERVQKQLTTEESAMQRLLNAINNTDIPQFRQIINSVGKGLIDLINGIGTGTGMGSLIGTNEKYYGESASGELYPVGTDKGKDFIENAPAGSTMTGGDGSQWTKLADGSTMITKKGKVYYVPAPSYGGYGGGGSNISFGAGSVYNPAGGTAAGGWSFGAGGTMVSGSGYVAGSSGGKNVIGAIGGAGTSGAVVPAYSGGQPHYSGSYGDNYVAPRTDGWKSGETLPGTSGNAPAGTEYDKWVLANGEPPNLTYKDTGVYSSGTSPSIKGADMRRDDKWAGQTVEKNGYVISYDENGYARSAINVRAGSAREDLANKYPRVDADGNIMYSKSGKWSSNTGRGYYYSTSDTVDDTIYWDKKNPNYVGGGSSSGSSSSKGSSSSSSDSGKSNQQRYLESLVASGNYGQKEWAKDQLNKGLYDSGGVLDGIGGIKATTKDETIFGPELSSKLLSPQKSKEFLNSATALTKILDNSSALSSMLNRFADLVSGNNSVPNDSHDVYFNGNPLGGMTRADSVALTSILRRYIPISGGGR